QAFPESEARSLRHVYRVRSPCGEGFDDGQRLQACPPVGQQRVSVIAHLGQDGRVTPMRDGRRRQRRSQSSTFVIRQIRKGQIDRSEGEQRGIAACSANRLQLIGGVHRQPPPLPYDLGPRSPARTLALPSAYWGGCMTKSSSRVWPR